MIGTAMGLRALKEREVLEARRRRWVVTREEKGCSVEYLAVACETCGQPWLRQRVLRLGEIEIQEWKEADTKSFRLTLRHSLWAVVTITLPVILGVGVYLASLSVIYSTLTFLVGAVCLSWPIFLHVKKSLTEKLARMKGVQEKILARHVGVSPDQVGMADNYGKEYVIIKE